MEHIMYFEAQFCREVSMFKENSVFYILNILLSLPSLQCHWTTCNAKVVLKVTVCEEEHACVNAHHLWIPDQQLCSHNLTFCPALQCLTIIRNRAPKSSPKSLESTKFHGMRAAALQTCVRTSLEYGLKPARDLRAWYCSKLYVSFRATRHDDPCSL